ncbi:uncharacterized protein G2W53_021820 [Senna tora]|uniref:Uncharacterized protein n=1 Tax=Senna tora TaxID=362788 RepID=A0A834TML6_9FABA|nr:uncharacterized protein G2W53_021820 [Senna tora]
MGIAIHRLQATQRHIDHGFRELVNPTQIP